LMRPSSVSSPPPSSLPSQPEEARL
jgi:hypothetical protein